MELVAVSAFVFLRMAKENDGLPEKRVSEYIYLLDRRAYSREMRKTREPDT